jgi:hypothetical protein
MNRTALTAILAALVGGAGTIVPLTATAQDAATTSDTQTGAIVAAAEAFLGTLSDEQRTAILFDWTDDEQRTRWSNFPLGIFERAGVPWADLNGEQRTALMDLLGAVLSPEGVQMVREQMAADDILSAEALVSDQATGGPPIGAGAPPPDGTAPEGTAASADGSQGGPPPGGPGGLIFGSAYYFVSFVGKPSETESWMLQFGGHHLAINATVAGPNVTLSPSLTGGQPVRFTVEDESVDIVADEVSAAGALIGSMDETQLGQAIRGTERIDLVLGPGKDGMVLQPEGLAGSAMSDEQKTLLLALVEARLGMLNADDLSARMAEIEADLDETFFAWWGPVNDPGSSYWRVTGPTLILEFSPQEMGGDPSQHLHNMYRDPTNEYGAAWVPE